LRESTERHLHIGKEVQVIKKEHNPRFDAVDVGYKFVNEDQIAYPPPMGFPRG
jgi:hypothetical protein